MEHYRQLPHGVSARARRPYSICSLKPIVSVDASRKHFSDPIVPCGHGSIIIAK